MPKRDSPLVQKLSSLLKASIFLAKMKKPVIPKVIMFLKKTRRLKKFKLMKQYSYYNNYVREYEFSPSTTPLTKFPRKARNGRISFKKLYSNVSFISRCLEKGMEAPLPPCIETAVGRDLTVAIDLSNESVDERAERFIQRFYEEMRRQRHESSLQLLEM